MKCMRVWVIGLVGVVGKMKVRLEVMFREGGWLVMMVWLKLLDID